MTPARRIAACVLLATLALSLAACGGTTKTVTVPGPASTASTATTAPKPAPASTPKPAPQPSEAPARIVHLTAFNSPTGNIGCLIAGGMARCDIVKRSWSLPARPASCPGEVDFGQGLQVGRSGPAALVCAGDTARDPSAAKLPYGTGTGAAGFLCVSRESGMTCTRTASGHGFTLSAQAYKLR